LDNWITGSLDNWITGSLDNWITGITLHKNPHVYNKRPNEAMKAIQQAMASMDTLGNNSTYKRFAAKDGRYK